MNREVTIVGAVVVTACAFPAEAHQLIDRGSLLLRSLTGALAPWQQTALVVVSLLFVFGHTRR